MEPSFAIVRRYFSCKNPRLYSMVDQHESTIDKSIAKVYPNLFCPRWKNLFLGYHWCENYHLVRSRISKGKRSRNQKSHLRWRVLSLNWEFVAFHEWLVDVKHPNSLPHWSWNWDKHWFHRRIYRRRMLEETEMDDWAKYFVGREFWVNLGEDIYQNDMLRIIHIICGDFQFK